MPSPANKAERSEALSRTPPPEQGNAEQERDEFGRLLREIMLTARDEVIGTEPDKALLRIANKIAPVIHGRFHSDG